MFLENPHHPWLVGDEDARRVDVPPAGRVHACDVDELRPRPGSLGPRCRGGSPDQPGLARRGDARGVRPGLATPRAGSRSAPRPAGPRALGGGRRPGVRHPSAPGGAGGVVERAGNGARRASPGPGHAGLPRGLGARPGRGTSPAEVARRWWRASSSRPCSPGRPVSSSRPCWCSSTPIPCAESPVHGARRALAEKLGLAVLGALAIPMGFAGARATGPRTSGGSSTTRSWPVPGASTAAPSTCGRSCGRGIWAPIFAMPSGRSAPGAPSALDAATVAGITMAGARRPTTLAGGPGGLDRVRGPSGARVRRGSTSGASSAWSTATAMPRAWAGPSRPGGRSPSRGKGGAAVDGRAGAPR